MIISNLRGGLGNQMFQYAICRNIAYSNNYDFALDIKSYGFQNKRTYDLHKFNIQNNIASAADISLCKNIYNEKNMKYDDKILNIDDNTYLIGYWQNVKYIQNIRDILLNEFVLKEYSNKFNYYKNNIKNTTISIHIRRGDYISEKHTNEYHGVCPLDYYTRSLLFLDNYIDISNILIFSDDKCWVKQNIMNNLSYYGKCTIVDGLSDIEELLLMKECHHNIIANSSFSWWGAWLNNNPDKIVVAPIKWFNDVTANNNQEIVPKEWYII